uniref:Uncharacterized protein n=1 Tax=Anguilla anguilla TaxID=7936 RepID=A0A0E9WDY7_ANGAN
MSFQLSTITRQRAGGESTMVFNCVFYSLKCWSSSLNDVEGYYHICLNFLLKSY